MDEETKVTETAEVAEGKKPSPFAGMKEKKGLKAKVKFFFEVLQKYPDVRQMVLYVLFSMICGLGQFVSQYVFTYALQLAPACQPPIKLFDIGSYEVGYTSIATFVGYLVGAVVGNTLTYILNRKKTFNATNNLTVSITLYFIMAFLITAMQTIAPGFIEKVATDSYTANGGSNGFVLFLCNFTGTAVAGLTALVVSFIGNKFVVMRDWTGDRIRRTKKKIVKLEKVGDVEKLEKAQAKLARLEEKDAKAKAKAQAHNEKIAREEEEKAKKRALKKKAKEEAAYKSDEE